MAVPCLNLNVLEGRARLWTRLVIDTSVVFATFRIICLYSVISRACVRVVSRQSLAQVPLHARTAFCFGCRHFGVVLLCTTELVRSGWWSVLLIVGESPSLI